MAKQAEAYARGKASQDTQKDAPVNDSVEGAPGIIQSTQLAPLGKGIYKEGRLLSHRILGVNSTL